MHWSYSVERHCRFLRHSVVNFAWGSVARSIGVSRNTFHMMALRYFYPALTDDIATALAVILVQSRLNYANFILFTTSTTNIKKAIVAQDAVARFLLPNFHFTPVSSLITRLHWLPVIFRIKLKYTIITITYKRLCYGRGTARQVVSRNSVTTKHAI